MSQTFEQVRSALATYNKSLAGIKRSYERPPESLQDFPCVLHLPATGTFEPESFGGDVLIKVHRIRQIVIARSRREFPKDEELLSPFVDRVPDHLQSNPDLGLGTLVGQPAMAKEYKLVNLDWGSVNYLALEFLVEVMVFDG